jgi:hypothetical protein
MSKVSVDQMDQSELRTADTGQGVFVLGTARSGTTALAQALMSAIGGFPYGESAVLPMLDRLIEAEGRYFNEFGDDYVGDERFFQEFYQEEFGDRIWIDKTANSEMILAAPLAADLFPAARFVSIRRRGLDVVLSRQRKFPKSTFRKNCEEWVAAIVSWEKVRPRMTGRYLEIEQQEMLADPHDLAGRLGLFLGFNEAQCSLLEQAWEGTRPEATSKSDTLTPVKLSETGWDPGKQELFLEICGSTMEDCGYEL